MWIGRIDLPSTNGKRRRATVKSMQYAEAVKKFNKLRREVEDGTYSTSGTMTVAKWCEQWLEEIVRPRVRPGTFGYYERTTRLHVVPHVGKIRLNKLTPANVLAMQRAVQKGSTRNAVAAQQVLQKALTDAIRWGLIARNVAELVDKPKHLTKSYGTLTADAARHLINTAVDRGDALASRWCAAFYTGMRPAELLGLTWEHVDLEAGLLEVAWQLQPHVKVHGCGEVTSSAVSHRGPEDVTYTCGRKRPGSCPKAKWNLPAGFDHRETDGSLLLTRPKTKAGWRVVPLAKPLLAMLRAHRAATAGRHNPHDLVWHVDGRPIHRRDDYAAWLVATVASGLARPTGGADPDHLDTHKHIDWEVRPPVPYISRHTMATMLAEAEVPENIAMLITGHSSVVAHRGYVHMGQGPKQAAIAALEAAYGDDDSQSA
jgi:integrase